MSFTTSNIKSALLGLTVGDAIGVPAEFKSRNFFKQYPVTGLSGYGTHHMPPGTFSDDGSLALCLAEALTHDFSLQRIANNFVAWRYNDFWAARGVVFDIGISTADAIERLKRGTPPELAGGFSESENGNGSLMRILPLLFYTHNKSIEDRYTITRFVSSITHGHTRSVIACFYYLEYARLLLQDEDKFTAYQSVKQTVTDHLRFISIDSYEINLFGRLLEDDVFKLREADIKSSGYVLHTLEASMWCLLTTGSYEDAVLKAVNLGEDTDTTGAVTGGLAGLLYGINDIPADWLEALARKTDIENLAERMAAKLL